ncbi:MAG: serine/threonine protein kinase [Pirellulales bacterium]|nr:serine/threonine protein kinase [Pirellulales bacterium]
MASIVTSRQLAAQVPAANSPSDSTESAVNLTVLAGGWRLVQDVHQGSLTAVYKARPSAGGSIDAAYALKLLLPEWEQNAAAQALIQREATIGRLAASPHLVPVLDARTHEAPFYVVMPWLDGASLSYVLERRGPLPLALALWVARQVAEALAVLHDCGWVHGDVKPDNILLAPSGHATLVDLGFARRPGDLGTGLDRVALGTAHYLAPECVNSQPRFDARSDLYALGVTLYELLSGPLSLTVTAPSVPGIDPPATARRYVDLRQRAPWVSREVAKFVAGLTAQEPLRRPQSARELVDELIGLEIEHLADRLSAA